MGRSRRALHCLALAVALLVAGRVVYQQAAAAGCAAGCVQHGLATFDPFAPSNGSGFSRMLASGLPARFDPCLPVHYVVNPSGAPASWRGDLDAALAVISSASGLTFAPDGTTDERPTRTRAAFQPRRYGARWAPVLFAWVAPGTNDVLPSGAAGDGGPVWVRAGKSAPVFVSGAVVLDREVAARLPGGMAGRLTHGRLLAHEIGHLVGLGHADDPASLMAPRVGWSPDVLTAGDRAGLALLGGHGRCTTVPHPQA